jgi:hypothetical protein
MKKKLAKMLSYLKDGEGIALENDTFLIGDLDGSDKLYGFFKIGGEILVKTRGSSGGYPIDEMDKADLDYMFKLSSISKKIEGKKYKIVKAEKV